MSQEIALEIVQIGVAGISVVLAVFAIMGAFRSGALTKVRIGSLSFEADTREAEKLRESIERSLEKGEEIPFEVEQLTNYYSQILAQSKISFWFSLIFASLGFVAILFAAFFYSSSEQGTTIAQFIAGLIMEAVASLFFIQSKNAQQSMGDFFDKLRKDRLYLESRKLCDSIEDTGAQDSLRLHLSLHYAGVEGAEGIAKHISETILNKSPNNAMHPTATVAGAPSASGDG